MLHLPCKSYCRFTKFVKQVNTKMENPWANFGTVFLTKLKKSSYLFSTLSMHVGDMFISLLSFLFISHKSYNILNSMIWCFKKIIAILKVFSFCTLWWYIWSFWNMVLQVNWRNIITGEVWKQYFPIVSFKKKKCIA